MVLATSFLQDNNFIDALYILAVILFILGLRGLSGPQSAVRGNKIAAVGMAIAVAATLLKKGVLPDGETLLLIVVGIAIGTAIGIPAALRVKMTQIPQMVALFNGVGGGAVALIAWAEYRRRFPGADGDWTLKAEIPSLFAAIIGSISFWGSNIAFAKLQEILPGKPIKLPGQQLLNLLLLVVAVGPACSATWSCCRSAARICRS
jgi:NAD(P) transhydrogenase subunit beta